MAFLRVPTRPRPSLLIRLAGVLVALVAGLALAGCGGEGTSTSCNLDSCTVTFERGGDAKTEVLGVDVKLVSVEGDNVTLEIAGNEVQAQVGQAVEVQGFQVEVQEVTDAEVKVKISQGGG